MSKIITGTWVDDINWEEYYESRGVKKGRTSKICSVCSKTIQVGHPSHSHKFYPEFYDIHTHDNHPVHGDTMPRGEKSCTEIFMEELEKQQK